MSFMNFFRRSKKVLIVEDDVKLRAALKAQFEDRSYVVLEAGDAHEVLNLMGKQNPDAIVLDLILPLKDGISLLEELRVAGHTLPVIILSNLLGSDSLRTDAERLDAVFYNKSATSLDQIVGAVAEQLRK